ALNATSTPSSAGPARRIVRLMLPPASPRTAVRGSSPASRFRVVRYDNPHREPSMDLRAYIRDVPDFPKPGVLFKDITPLLSDPDAFAYACAKLAAHFATRGVDAIAAAEARGFLFAAPMALELHKPLIPLRKPGKLPYTTHRHKYDLEYGSAELHVHTDAVPAGARVLLVDDVLAT